MSIQAERSRSSAWLLWRLACLLLFVPLVLSAAGIGRPVSSFAVRAEGVDPPVVLFDVCIDSTCTDPLLATKSDLIWAWDSGSYDPDGYVDLYSIDWGDGSPAESDLFVSGLTFGFPHMYAASGTYLVTLTLTDNDGMPASATRTVEVANLQPTASFTFSPAEPYVNQEVTFDGSGSADPDGSIASWDWDFGDGSQATGSPVTHAFADAIDYLVVLTVTDDEGSSSEPASQTVSVLPPPNQAPTMSACHYTPDLGTGTPYSCGVSTNPPGYVNETLEFNASVSDPEGDSITVTFYFDYYNIVAGKLVENPTSPKVEVTVTPDAPGQVVNVTTTWTYDRLGNITVVTNESSRYWVRIETRDGAGASDTVLGATQFGLVVAKNIRAYLSGLDDRYPKITPKITFPDLEVPLVYVNVSVEDPDNDTLRVTWDWGDGSADVFSAPLLNRSADLNMTHQYRTETFNLNITSAEIVFNITIWADDGKPEHNGTPAGTTTAVFNLWYDFPPTVVIDDPSLKVPWWKVGEVVPMRGRAIDPESQPITLYYWDFDNATDSDGDGNPRTDRDALGNVSSHVFTAPGFYEVTLWATDGEDKYNCWSEACTGANRTSHWSRARRVIEVRENTPPLLIAGSKLFVGLAGEPINLSAAMIEEDGDNMTVTWDFGDGTPNATDLVPGGSRGSGQTIEVVEPHVFDAVGFYNVTIRSSDGDATNETIAMVFAGSNNLPPIVFGFTVLGANGTVRTNASFGVGELFYFGVNVSDPEGDILVITVQWGDGTSNTTNASAKSGAYDVPLVAHSYSAPGDYETNISVTDNKMFLWLTDPANLTVEHRPHVAYRTGPTVNVSLPLPPKVEAPWDWWDYSTLAVVLGVPGALTARAAYQISRERKED